jgi:hypothetical protein
MKPCVCFCFILLLFKIGFTAPNNFIKITSEPKHNAWWFRIEYYPFENSIRNISLKEIDKSWCKANEFNISLFPDQIRIHEWPSLNEYMNLPRNSFSLSFTPRPNLSIEVITGVYESCLNEKGTFLLFIKNDKILKTYQLALTKFNMKEYPFIYLKQISEKEFEVWCCFNCDSPMQYIWNGKKSSFEIVQDK